jgi:chorismate mutase
MNLQELRQEIDRIDTEIVRLLNERAKNAVCVGDEKKKDGIPLQDVGREQEVQNLITHENGGPISDEDMSRVYERIISACTQVQVTHSDM